jgi:hypothetical protein
MSENKSNNSSSCQWMSMDVSQVRSQTYLFDLHLVLEVILHHPIIMFKGRLSVHPLVKRYISAIMSLSFGFSSLSFRFSGLPLHHDSSWAHSASWSYPMFFTSHLTSPNPNRGRFNTERSYS